MFPPPVLMTRFRRPMLLILLWPCIARRSFLIGDSQVNTLTKALVVSDGSREGLLPGGFRKTRFPSQGPQAGTSHGGHNRGPLWRAPRDQPLALSPKSRVHCSLSSRRQVLTGVAHGIIGGCSFLLRPPLAMAQGSQQYTIVASGSIADKEKRLVEVQRLFALNPDDPYAFGEKAQLEYDIGMLRKNSEYASELSRELAEGRQTLFRGLRIAVPDLAAALRFWTEGCGALVQDSRIDGGRNVTTVAFGSQSLRRDDGAKFALELVEDATALAANSPLEYIQLAIPVFRLTKVMDSGGEIIQAYGWTEVDAPGGVRLRVRIDESRRDPFEFVALRTSDLRLAQKYYEEMGMRKSSANSRRKLKKSINANTLFESEDPYTPPNEAGSVLAGYGDPALTTWLLLLPPKKRALAVKLAPVELLLVGNNTVSQRRDPDGVLSTTVSYDEFKSALGRVSG